LKTSLEASEFIASIPGRGISYADKYRYFHEHWQGHVSASRQAIMRGLPRQMALGDSIGCRGLQRDPH